MRGAAEDSAPSPASRTFPSTTIGCTDIALVRMELEQAKLEEIDVEGLLDFAEHVLNNAAHLWLDASPELKRRLQTVIFPEGLRFRDGKIGTATTCLAFSQLQGIGADREGLASPICTSWNHMAGWLRALDGLRRAA